MCPPGSAAAAADPPRQQVHAFLPLCSYGLRFSLNADWVVPSSRESVCSGNAWNDLLRNQIPAAFVAMVEAAKSHPDARLMW